MVTEVVQVDPQGSCDTAVRRATEVLSQGGLVAFPTETVYGVAAFADNRDAIARLRTVKTRPTDKAFTVHIGSRENAARFVPTIPGIASRLIRKAWPGPLTLILDVADADQAGASAGLSGSTSAAIYYDGTIGLRCPDNRIAEAILRASGSPVVAASANPAGHPPPHTASDVLTGLDGRIDLLVDAGRTKHSDPSTIVRVTGHSYTVVREGVIDVRTVERLSKLRLLFVCTGNTCRSPMAAALAEKLLADHLECKVNELASHGVVVCSAGTGGGFGSASENALREMARRGIDISQHVSTHLSAELIQQSDHIYTMTRSHRDSVISMVSSAGSRVAVLLNDRDVQDPIGGSERDYESCAHLIEEGMRKRLQEVKL